MEDYVYVDNKDKEHYISKAGLDKAIEYKAELAKSNGSVQWGMLCRLLKQEGYDAKNSVGFRELLSNYQDPKNKDLKKEFEDPLDKEIGSFNLAKRDAQNVKKDFNKLRRKVTDGRLFQKEILKSLDGKLDIKVSPKVNQAINKASASKGKNLVVGLSDWHIGSKFKAKNYEYNFSIFKQAISSYLSQIKHRISQEQPKEVYIVSCGDLLENAYMRGQDQAYALEFNLAEQQAHVIEELSNFIAQVCSFTKAPVYFTGIAGNHDRSAGNIKENIYGDGFITVIGTVIKELSKQIKQLTYIEPDSPYRTHLTIGHNNIKIIHGDIDKIHNKDLLANFSQNDGRLYNCLLLGHEHHYEIKEQNGLYYMLGSIKGADPYSDKLLLNSGRSQGLLWITEDDILQPEVVIL